MPQVSDSNVGMRHIPRVQGSKISPLQCATERTFGQRRKLSLFSASIALTAKFINWSSIG
jgi:hypothetical protein